MDVVDPQSDVLKLHNLLELVPVPAYTCDVDGRITHYNRQAVELWGRTPSLDGERWCGAYRIRAGDHTEVGVESCWLARAVRERRAFSGKEKIIERPDGSTRFVLSHAHPLFAPDGKVVGGINIQLDVTDRQQMGQALRDASQTDSLTGLPNRVVLLEHLRYAVARARNDPTHQFAVLFMDFDRFKTVNDSLSHRTGDRLLKEMANRINAALRAELSPGSDVREIVAARLGGDEFVVLLGGLSHIDHAHRVAERLVHLSTEPYFVDDHEIYCTVSIGMVTSCMSEGGPDDVLRDADTAMYEAKAAGRSRYVVFDQAMRQRVVTRMTLEHDLRHALAENQLWVAYQPIVSLATAELESFEALVRWNHPTRGPVSPVEFVPIAEETGLIVPIGEWVLRTACAQFASWRKQFGARAPRSISVNVSRRQLVSPGFVSIVSKVLREHQIDPTSLHLEITESEIMRDPQRAVEVLHGLRGIGVKIDMDDFGTGYSSLACLRQLPIDVLKIDRSFVSSMGESRDLAALVHAVTQMAMNIGISVVAEGIEQPEQAAMLQAMDCQFGQGYFFARPMRVDEVGAYVMRPPATAA